MQVAVAGNLETVRDDTDPPNPLATLIWDASSNPLRWPEFFGAAHVTAEYAPGDPTLDPAYDRFGHRTGLVLDDGGSPLAHAWAFNALDQMTGATLPGNASALGFSYYDNDDLLQIIHGGAGVVTDLTYHPEGPVDTITVTGSSQSRYERNLQSSGPSRVPYIRDRRLPWESRRVCPEVRATWL